MNKAIIFDFKRFSVHDGPGIRQTVFFKGCPLTCWWCHNPESQDIKCEANNQKQIGKVLSVEEIMQSIRKDELYYDESGGGVTFSGGEPLMQHEFVTALAEKCKKEHIHTTLDTTGYTSPKIFERFINVIDLFLFDLKLMDSKEHFKYTGVPNKRILHNLKLLDEKKKNVWIRFPVIPGINDTKQNIQAMKAFLSELKTIRKIELMPYHVIANHKYKRFEMENKMQGIKALSKQDIPPLKKEFEEIGFTCL